MADEQDTTETPEPDATEAPKPKRSRAAKPKAEAAEAEAKPKRTRAAAKPKAEQAEGEATAEEAPKPKRTRAAKPKAAEAEATTEAAAEEAPAEPAEEAPKPKRARAAKPAATPRRRGAGEAPGRPVIVRAQAKYVRSSARKARLVCDHLRGKSVDEARAILAFTPRAIARDWSKVLESAVANAEHNHELVGEDLVVKAAHADEGPTLKRFRPRAMGRATPIHKRTSHLTILLTPKG